MTTHIQFHRSNIAGATPDVSYMFVGEPAVNLYDKKLWVKGISGDLITFIDGTTGERVAGSNTEIQFKDANGFSASGKLVFDGHGLSADGATFGGVVTIDGATFGGDVVVRGGISADSTATFGGDVTVDSNFLYINGALAHNGDSNTKLVFGTDNTSIQSGGTKFLEGNANGVLHAPVGISGGGATFGGDVVVRGGISADAGATFGGPIIIHNAEDAVLTLYADSDDSGENDNPHINFKQDAGQNTFQIGMAGNAGSYFTDSRANTPYINSFWGMQVGTNTDLAIDIDRYGLVHLTGGLSADAGATFGGDVWHHGNIYLPEDGAIQIGNDVEKIVFNGAGSGSSSIDLSVSMVDFGNGSGCRLRSATDTNTEIRFVDDHHGSGQDSLQLIQGGFVGVQVNPIDVNVAGATFHGGGATFSNTVLISGDLTHAGDTDTKLSFGTNSLTLTAGGTACVAVTGTKTNFADTEVERPRLKDYSETVNAIGTITDDTTIDIEAGNVATVTVGGDCEFDFENFPGNGIAGTLTLIITNGGAHTTTWNSAVKWPGDNAPALSSSGVDIVSFMNIDAGTNIYGFVGGINFS